MSSRADCVKVVRFDPCKKDEVCPFHKTIGLEGVAKMKMVDTPVIQERIIVIQFDDFPTEMRV